MKLKSYADYRTEPVAWSFEPWLPFGEVVLLAGAKKVAKSTLVLTWAQMMASGDPWPGTNARRVPRNVLLCNLEDQPETGTSMRLDRMGVPDEVRARILDITVTEEGDSLSLPGSIGYIREAADLYEPGLIIIDTLERASEKGLTAGAIKSFMPALTRLARECQCVVLVVGHETKNGEIAGGQQLVNQVRVVLHIHKDPEVPTDRILRVEATNLSGEVRPLRYCVEDSRIVWLTRDELESRRNRKRRQAREHVLAAPEPIRVAVGQTEPVRPSPARTGPTVAGLGRFARGVREEVRTRTTPDPRYHPSPNVPRIMTGPDDGIRR